MGGFTKNAAAVTPTPTTNNVTILERGLSSEATTSDMALSLRVFTASSTSTRKSTGNRSWIKRAAMLNLPASCELLLKKLAPGS